MMSVELSGRFLAKVEQTISNLSPAFSQQYTPCNCTFQENLAHIYRVHHYIAPIYLDQLEMSRIPSKTRAQLLKTIQMFQEIIVNFIGTVGSQRYMGFWSIWCADDGNSWSKPIEVQHAHKYIYRTIFANSLNFLLPQPISFKQTTVSISTPSHCVNCKINRILSMS